MNANGAAIVAWSEQIAGGLYQAGRRGTASARHALADQVLRTGDDNGDRDPVVAITGNGYGFVGWTQHDGLGNF